MKKIMELKNDGEVENDDVQGILNGITSFINITIEQGSFISVKEAQARALSSSRKSAGSTTTRVSRGALFTGSVKQNQAAPTNSAKLSHP